MSISGRSDNENILKQPEKNIEQDFFLVREQLLHRIILLFAIVSLPAVIAGVVKLWPLRDWLIIFAYIGGYALAIFGVIIRKHEPYIVMARATVIGLFVFGFILLLRFGTNGAGFLFLLTFCVLTYSLLGRRAGFFAILATMLAIGLTGYLLVSGILSIHPETLINSKSAMTWALATVLLSVLAVILNSIFGTLVSHLQNALRINIERNEKLEEMNNRLQAEIAERELAARVIKEQKEFLYNVIDNLPVIVCVKDRESRFVLANKTLAQAYGTTPQQMIGKTDAEFLEDPQEIEKFARDDREVIEHRKEMRIAEEKMTDSSGLVHWLMTYKTPMFDEDGSCNRLLAISSDITDQKKGEEERIQLEEQLRQAMKMEAIGRLAGGVAHDFNNLLTGINGYTEMLMRKVSPSDPMYSDLDEIRKAGKRGASLTAQLLAFGRKQVIDPRAIDLNELLLHSSRMLKRLIGEDIELQFLPGPTLGYVKADPGQIEQILINLAVNARDAMPDGGVLTIETSNTAIDEEYCRNRPDATPGGYVMLAVSDNGCGMSDEVKEHIFEPFFTTKEKDKGTGLGLAMIYGIVKQNKGFINLYSEKNYGTAFKIYLPLIESPAEAVNKVKTKSAPTGDESILLVEDEEMVRNLAKKVLEGQGYKVFAAVGGLEAIHLVKNNAEPIQLLLTDVIMPNMNGRQLYEMLKPSCPQMKILFMSGYTENVIAHHGVLDAGTHFIQKPFTIDLLIRKVREVLDN